MPREEVSLPAVYHENVLCLMVQEPAVVFAYWDLSFGHWQAIGGQKELVLCLSKDSQIMHKVNLPPFTNNWYFHYVEPGHEYYCELGFSGTSGTFIPLLRSNRVTTPRLTPGEESWEAGRINVDLFPSLSEQKKASRLNTVSSLSFYPGLPPKKE